MKAIKKVAVTPATQNTGAIIDSFNTSDDKHTNAPSLNAVETKLTEVNTAIAQCVAKGDIAVVTGTISLTDGTGNTTIDYPTGFNSTNCVPISVGLTIVTPYSYFSHANMVFCARLTTDNIVVTCTATDGVGSTATKNAKVVLMKVS